MSLIATAGAGLAAVLALMVGVWLASLRARDASLVDRFWGLGFVLLAWVYALLGAELDWRRGLVLVLVTAWGLRLSVHIHLRNRGHGEDYRYAAMRERHGSRFALVSLYKVFLLQGVLAWIIAAPLLAVMALPGPAGPTLLDVLGTALWTLGFVFEAVGDWQLARFKADPANRGRLYTGGLWSLTRHPNYFGDATLWWGYGAFACVVPGGWIALAGPALMTGLIRYVSGVSLLEQDLSQRKPGYEEYVARTPAFIPRPWRRRAGG